MSSYLNGKAMPGLHDFRFFIHWERASVFASIVNLQNKTRRTVMQDPRLQVEPLTDPMSSKCRTYDIVLALYDPMDRLRNVPEGSPRPACSDACLKGFFGNFDEVASNVILLHAQVI